VKNKIINLLKFNTMKKRVIILATLIALMMMGFVELQAQKNDPNAIAISVILPSGIDGFPDMANTALTNKLYQVTTANGIAGTDGFVRFFITAIPAVMTKDVVPGPPPQIAQNLDVTFYIADYFDQKIFATTSISCKGVGTNETKAYLDALKNISPSNAKLKDFVELGKRKIIEYYTAQCDNIINKAKSLAGQKSYEEAIYMLTSIPQAVQACYDKSLAETQIIYQQYIDHLCNVNLAFAKSAWAAEQNSTGAQKAGEYMSYIYPDAKCYGEAQVLHKEIKAKVLDDWKFVMKMYQDQVDLESQRISAWRDVGVAYGKNQKPTTYNIAWLHH
jgi:hypothetical protein